MQLDMLEVSIPYRTTWWEPDSGLAVRLFFHAGRPKTWRGSMTRAHHVTLTQLGRHSLALSVSQLHSSAQSNNITNTSAVARPHTSSPGAHSGRYTIATTAAPLDALTVDMR
jgi:hypothetical protein